MQQSPFLKTILKLDAASCLVMAASLVPGAGLLEPVLGIPSAVLAAAGTSLIPIGLFILWLGFRERAASAILYLVILGNVGWSGASFASLGLLPGITTIGLALLVAQALAVGLFAMLELRGVKESRWASAA